MTSDPIAGEFKRFLAPIDGLPMNGLPVEMWKWLFMAGSRAVMRLVIEAGKTGGPEGIEALMNAIQDELTRNALEVVKFAEEEGISKQLRELRLLTEKPVGFA